MKTDDQDLRQVWNMARIILHMRKEAIAALLFRSGVDEVSRAKKIASLVADLVVASQSLEQAKYAMLESERPR